MGNSSSRAQQERNAFDSLLYAEPGAPLQTQPRCVPVELLNHCWPAPEDSSLPVELMEAVITAAWTLPMNWRDRQQLRVRLSLVNSTWRAAVERTALAHVWTKTSKQALAKTNEALSQHPGTNPRTYRDFCTSLTLRLVRGIELVMFMRDVAPFLSSFKHLQHFGIDNTGVLPTKESNLVETRSGLTTLSTIFDLLQLAGPGVTSLELKLGCPTMAYPDFTAPDHQQQAFPLITHLSVHSDDGNLVRSILHQCHKVQHLRLTCAFYGVLPELPQLLPWLAELTLVMTPHHPMRAPCAHVDANTQAGRAPLVCWPISEGLKRGLLQPDFRGRDAGRGTLAFEGTSLEILRRADIAALATVMRTARKNGVKVECRPLQEHRACFAEYAVPQPVATGGHTRGASHATPQQVLPPRTPTRSMTVS